MVATLQAKPVAHIVVGFRGHSVPAAARHFFSSLPVCVLCMYVRTPKPGTPEHTVLLNNDPWEPREDRCFSSIYVLAATFHSTIEIR